MNSNLRELELLRKEIESTRACIHSFASLVFGGAGLGALGFAATDGIMAKSDTLALAAFGLGLVTSVLLFITCYKFSSTNRYSGYTKLLAHERYSLPPERAQEDVVGWEPCMQQLREFDFEDDPATGWFRYAANMPLDVVQGGVADLQADLAQVAGRAPLSDQHAGRRGLSRLFRLLRQGRSDTRSWAYPENLVLAFLIFYLLLTGAGMFLVIANGTTVSVTLVSIVALTASLWIWRAIASRLHKVSEGSRTVSAYCWKFIAIRHRFLAQKYRVTDYQVIVPSP